jgi:hypothetical protein
LEKRRPLTWHHLVRRLRAITSRQQQPLRTVLDCLRVRYETERPSNKPLTPAELDSNTWVSEVKRLRGKKQVLKAVRVLGLREEYTHSIEPARASHQHHATSVLMSPWRVRYA